MHELRVDLIVQLVDMCGLIDHQSLNSLFRIPKITGAPGMEFPLFYLLSVYIFIFNKLSLLFHLVFHVVFCPYIHTSLW